MDNRYYFEEADKSGKIILIKNQEFQHLAKVRRAKIGDKITAFCGDGKDYILELTNIAKNYAECEILEEKINECNKAEDITIYIASIKSDALDQALDSLTQLNVKDIVIFNNKYANVKYSQEKVLKMKNKFIQFSKQCERADIPNLKIISFNDMTEELKQKDLNILAYENAKENFLSLELEKFKGKSISIIIGGEGGFSETEIEKLNSLTKRVSLGKTILRAPVAVAVATGCVKALLGEFERNEG
ncbi:MAG: RsmE family RNA methyltransferase [Clostridia bacterium]|nr:RsmE family RNA methyltransferase [Clostridia bacterium]